MKHSLHTYSNFCPSRVLACLGFSFVASATLASDPAKPGPAKLEGTVKEADLAKIILLPEAEQRLGIETAPVDERPVQRTRLFGGEVVIPQGQLVTITAPLTGRVKSPETTAIVAGGSVVRGQPVFRLWPVLGSKEEVLSPSDRISLLRASVDIDAATVEAEGLVTKAQVAVDAAKLKFARVSELQERNAGSVKAVEEARAESESAEATLKAAQRRRDFLSRTNVDPAVADVPDLAIESPIDGVLQQVAVAENQLVTAGTPLFSVANLKRVWIRVPIYVGDAALICDAPAKITTPRVSGHEEIAHRIPAPQSANASAATTDLFFELANPDSGLSPGQRVFVMLPMGEPATRLTVPASAIVYDIHGGTWIYENIEPHVFARRRVDLERIDGPVAILRRGTKPGSVVVTTGVAELYGTEFGVGK